MGVGEEEEVGRGGDARGSDERSARGSLRCRFAPAASSRRLPAPRLPALLSVLSHAGRYHAQRARRVAHSRGAPTARGQKGTPRLVAAFCRLFSPSLRLGPTQLAASLTLSSSYLTCGRVREGRREGGENQSAGDAFFLFVCVPSQPRCTKITPRHALHTPFPLTLDPRGISMTADVGRVEEKRTQSEHGSSKTRTKRIDYFFQSNLTREPVRRVAVGRRGQVVPRVGRVGGGHGVEVWFWGWGGKYKNERRVVFEARKTIDTQQKRRALFPCAPLLPSLPRPAPWCVGVSP